MAWAYLIANEHIFNDGNKSTATLVLKFIVEKNDHHFSCNDALLENVVNGMVPDNEEEPNPKTIGNAAEVLRGSYV